MLYNTIRSSQTLGEYITASSITADTVKKKKNKVSTKKMH